MPKIYCAIDTSDIAYATDITSKLMGYTDGIKLGLEFFVANGPDGVRRVTRDGAIPLFLDLKFHDIPNTVAGAVKSAIKCSPAIITIHANGGSDMMRRAYESAHEEAEKLGVIPPKIVGVTVLTSMDSSDLDSIGVSNSDDVQNQVMRLVTLAMEAGIDGCVCSAHEIKIIRENFGDKPLLIVPGIRPAGSDSGDQKRVMTPKEAAEIGADILVIGRPITQAQEPVRALTSLQKDLA